jgi:ATP-dependent RNA helicase RhlE
MTQDLATATAESTTAAAAPDTALFASFNLDPRLEASVLAMGYTMATPIQTQAIPLVMQGFDVMGAAQTGTGKTAAFALPILHRMLPMASSSPSPARHPVKALILAPTRELADQIYVNVRDYAKGTPIRTAVIFGGMDFKPQEAQLRAGVDVLIATPGRLLDHVASKVLNLSQVNMLVLDEADRMLDMGFMPDLDRIVALLPKVRQTLLFSATFSEEIRKLAKTFLTQTPHYIETAKRNATAENVKQRVIEVQGGKEAALITLLKQNKNADANDAANTALGRSTQQTIVFVNSKLGCTRIARHLQRVGLRAEAIHGDRSQQERLATLVAFKANLVDVLVATDVAARGLDIAELPCVINYDVPYHAEDYVHRIGRTGRAGASGAAYTLYTPDEARSLADVEKFIKRTIEREQLQAAPDTDYQERERLRELRKRRHDAMEHGESRERSHPERAAPRPAYRQQTDPFFNQLYVPSAPTASVVVVETIAADSSTNIAPKAVAKQKTGMAALFGGKR